MSSYTISYTFDDDATDARHRNEWLSRLVEVTTILRETVLHPKDLQVITTSSSNSDMVADRGWIEQDCSEAFDRNSRFQKFFLYSGYL